MKKWIDSIQFQKADLHYYILLLSPPLLLLIYRYFFQAGHFAIYFHHSSPNYSFITHIEAIYQFAAFFILAFLCPFFYILFSKRKMPSRMGLQRGDDKTGWMIVLISIPFILLISCISSTNPTFQSEYPLAKNLLQNKQFIFSYELAYVVLYYVAWEFYFRGFLLFGLKDKYGAMAAILIQTIASALVHIGKPMDEALGSIFAGILLGVIALRTESILYTFILHALLGVSLDLFIIFNPY